MHNLDRCPYARRRNHCGQSLIHNGRRRILASRQLAKEELTAKTGRRKIEPEEYEHIKERAREISGVVEEAIEALVPKALEVKEWLAEVADVLTAAEVPFTWQHPLTGFPLHMRYQKGDRQKVTPTPSKNRTPKHIYFTVFPHDAKLNARKQRTP